MYLESEKKAKFYGNSISTFDQTATLQKSLIKLVSTTSFFSSHPKAHSPSPISHQSYLSTFPLPTHSYPLYHPSPCISTHTYPRSYHPSSSAFSINYFPLHNCRNTFPTLPYVPACPPDRLTDLVDEKRTRHIRTSPHPFPPSSFPGKK